MVDSLIPRGWQPTPDRCYPRCQSPRWVRPSPRAHIHRYRCFCRNESHTSISPAARPETISKSCYRAQPSFDHNLSTHLARVARHFEQKETCVAFGQEVIGRILLQHLQHKVTSTKIGDSARQTCAAPHEAQEQRTFLQNTMKFNQTSIYISI